MSERGQPGPPEEERGFETLDPNLQAFSLVARGMAVGDEQVIRLNVHGRAGLTDGELRALEEECFSVVSAPTQKPPVYLQLKRAPEGAQVRLFRYSQTNQSWEAGFELTIDPNSLRIKSMDARRNRVMRPVFDKLAKIIPDLVENMCQDQPNRVVRATFFETSPSRAYWAQLCPYNANLPEETSEQPLYRLYVHSGRGDMATHIALARQVVDLTRAYTEPLHYKFMFAGERAKDVIANPDATKIVFYFPSSSEGKAAAERWGDFLSTHLQFHTTPPVDLSTFTPQRTWLAGHLILGKGTREKRGDILDRLQATRGDARKALLALARMHSITL